MKKLVFLFLILVLLAMGFACNGKNSGESSQIESLSVENEALINENDALKAEKDDLVDQNVDLNKEIDYLNAQLELLTSENKNLDSQLATLSNERDSLNALLEVLSDERADLVSQVDALLAQVAALQEQLNQPFYNFNSVSELEQWLAQDETNTMQYIPIEFDCEDFAMMLQEHALEDGYIMSILLLFNYPEPGQTHVVNLVVIDNTAYYVDPQTDEITGGLPLD